jgi:TrpR family trp operon transcriptional repressor
MYAFLWAAGKAQQAENGYIRRQEAACACVPLGHERKEIDSTTPPGGGLCMQTDDPRVEENIGELSRTLSKLNDSELIESFLRCLLTPAETADIAARWALVKSLKQKIPQRKIAKDLGISLCKITRGSRELKKSNSAFERILREAQKD